MKSEKQSFEAQELPDLSPVASSQGEDTILTCSICAPWLSAAVICLQINSCLAAGRL